MPFNEKNKIVYQHMCFTLQTFELNTQSSPKAGNLIVFKTTNG